MIYISPKDDLNQLELEYGQIARARNLQQRLDGYDLRRGVSPQELVGGIHKFSTPTICDKQELAWPAHLLSFNPWGTIRMLLKR
jgi:hypothetical protein